MNVRPEEEIGPQLRSMGIERGDIKALPESFGPFEQSSKVTQSGDVVIVPTPGHTPGHVSVVVNTEDVVYFLGWRHKL